MHGGAGSFGGLPAQAGPGPAYGAGAGGGHWACVLLPAACPGQYLPHTCALARVDLLTISTAATLFPHKIPVATVLQAPALPWVTQGVLALVE